MAASRQDNRSVIFSNKGPNESKMGPDETVVFLDKEYTRGNPMPWLIRESRVSGMITIDCLTIPKSHNPNLPGSKRVLSIRMGLTENGWIQDAPQEGRKNIDAKSFASYAGDLFLKISQGLEVTSKEGKTFKVFFADKNLLKPTPEQASSNEVYSTYTVLSLGSSHEKQPVGYAKGKFFSENESHEPQPQDKASGKKDIPKPPSR